MRRAKTAVTKTNQGAGETMGERVSCSQRLRRGLLALAVTACAAIGVLGAVPGSALADFGLLEHEVKMTNADGSPSTQAGSHPFAVTTTVGLNYIEPGFFEWDPDEVMTDLLIEQVPGLVGDTTAIPRCSTADFLTSIPGKTLPECPDDTAVGVTAVSLIAPAPFIFLNAAVYNVEPPPGVPAEIGFSILNERVLIQLGVKQGGEYNVVAKTLNFPQPLKIFGATLQLWGNPSDPRHNNIRGHCIGSGFEAYSEGELNFEIGSTGSCPVERIKPFLTLPRSCSGPGTISSGARQR